MCGCAQAHTGHHNTLLASAAPRYRFQVRRSRCFTEAAHDSWMHDYALLGNTGRITSSAMVLNEHCCSHSASTRPRSDLSDPACLAPTAKRRAIDVRTEPVTFFPLLPNLWSLALDSGSKASNRFQILTTRTTLRRSLNDLSHETQQVRPSALPPAYTVSSRQSRTTVAVSEWLAKA